ncbi:MAG TPA: ferredoxin [Polyangiaceae bacterium]|jgi:ferredoxin|nr:ferredoxin [Polyangiaceae bacterium]
MRVVIDWDLCQGHAICMGEAPEVFEVGEDGELKILQERPPESLRSKVELAVRYCPTGAITLEKGD